MSPEFYQQYIELWCEQGHEFSTNPLDIIPQEIKTTDFFKLALDQGISLAAIPIEYKEQLVHHAVKVNGLDIRYIPSSLLTQALCDLAVKQNGHALYHVPYEFVSFENTLSAFRSVIELGNSTKTLESIVSAPMLNKVNRALDKELLHRFKFLDKDDKDYELCLSVIRQFPKEPYLLQHIPKEHKTYELCLERVKSTGFDGLQSIPFEHRDEAMCLAAVSINGKDLVHVSAQFKSKKMCDIAMNNCSDKNIIHYIPTEYRDKKKPVNSGLSL